MAVEGRVMDEKLVKKAIVLMFFVQPRPGESIHQYVARAEHIVAKKASGVEEGVPH